MFGSPLPAQAVRQLRDTQAVRKRLSDGSGLLSQHTLAMGGAGGQVGVLGWIMGLVLACWYMSGHILRRSCNFCVAVSSGMLEGWLPNSQRCTPFSPV